MGFWKEENMKEMIKRVREEKGGFTLAELLVVVAIIAVLVAIAIPVFTGSLNKANAATDEANIRSGYAQAQTFCLTGRDNANEPIDVKATYYLTKSGGLETTNANAYVTKGSSADATDVPAWVTGGWSAGKKASFTFKANNDGTYTATYATVD